MAGEEATRKEARETLDVTLPSRMPRLGHLHPVTIVRRQLEDIFREMSYSIDPGPEIETDWYNFEALNFTPDHPARDTQDTFFVDIDKLLLRTHTSNVQIRSMEILGCGMVHPQVLRNCGIDPEEWSGFAFGLGLDRVAMIKFDIPNIRTLLENDLRVLQQF